MNDSEIRDTMRRGTTPELLVSLQLGNGQQTTAQFAAQDEISRPVTLRVLVSNRSAQPAFHTIVMVGLDTDLVIRTTGDFGQTGAPTGEPQSGKNWLTRRLSSPPAQPIFQEAEPLPLSFTFSVRSEHLHGTLFRLTTVVQTPGYAAEEKWIMICEGGRLTLYDPTHHRTRTAG